MPDTSAWPQIDRFIGCGTSQELIRMAPHTQHVDKILAYLDRLVPELAEVEGFSPRRLCRTIKEGVDDFERFLDARAELEVLRLLAPRFQDSLEWQPQIGQPIVPDLRFLYAGEPIYLEVTRLRRTAAEQAWEDFVTQRKAFLSERSGPFGVLLFVDVSTLVNGIDTMGVVNDAIEQTLCRIEALKEDQLALREIRRAAFATRQARDAEIHEVLESCDDPEAKLRCFLDAAMNGDSPCREFELLFDGAVVGSASLFYHEEEARISEIEVFGRLPDHSNKIWQELAEEVRQLPRGEAGLVLLWVDRNAAIADLLSPEGRLIRKSVRSVQIEWRSSLEIMFRNNRDRLSGVIFHSGFERELVLNPSADAAISKELAQELQDLLSLQKWGYLVVS